MKTISILAIAAASLALVFLTASPLDSNDVAFQSFINEHGRNLASMEEYNFRKGVFLSTLKKVEEHNAKGLSWTLAINKFADWTDEEYNQLLGLKRMKNANSALPTIKLPKAENLAAIDWRNKTGYVGPVLDQGHCGSCWAFSAAQTLAGSYYKAYGEVIDPSRSQAVDCDFFSHGCEGGLQENAFLHWMKHPFVSEADYPYVAEDRECQENSIQSNNKLLKSAFRVDVGDELLYDALTHMPVSISIRAENDNFRNYDKGVIRGEACGHEIDHAVLLVGYDAVEDAWIVKNSWGPTWSEEGYVRIRRGDGMGICGINQENSQAVYDDSDYQ